jgi:predicted ArsR family transcriptional regulator
MYALSDQAQELFPTAYDVLLKLVIEALVQREGVGEAQHVLNAVGERLAENVIGGVRNPDLRAQVEALSAALADRGIPIAVVEAGESITLHEWCCPFYSLAREHDGICEMEQRMLEHALGAKVTLAERRLDGHVGCKFLVESSAS